MHALVIIPFLVGCFVVSSGILTNPFQMVASPVVLNTSVITRYYMYIASKLFDCSTTGSKIYVAIALMINRSSITHLHYSYSECMQCLYLDTFLQYSSI